MTKSKRYGLYKYSGEEWIGEIPEHWKIGALRWYLSCKSGDFISNTEVENYKTEDKVIPVIGGNGIMGYSDKYNVTDTTIAIGRVGALCGNVHCLDFLCWITDNSLIINRLNSEIAIAFLEKFLKALNLNQFSTSTAQPLITGETIKKRKICIPPIEEQEEIAKFLDKKISEIDALIHDKKNLITLLEEKRQAVVTETVTKGLNPNVRMKDSGVESIGAIPEHWKIKKLKYNCYMKGRIGWQGLKQSEFIDEGPYLVTGMNFKGGKINWDEVYHITEERYNEAPEIQLKTGDVLITKDGTIGKLLYIDHLPGKASLNSHLLVMRPKNNDFIPKYLYYSLDAEYFKKYVELIKTGTTFFGITQEAVSNFRLILPTIEEQRQIVQFIDKKLQNIDETKELILNQVKKLKRYRESIIFESVTGKIDVRTYLK